MQSTATMKTSAVRGLRALPAPKARSTRRAQVVTRAASIAADDVPDMNKRNIMNLLLLGAVAAPVSLLGGPFLYFFVPKR